MKRCGILFSTLLIAIIFLKPVSSYAEDFLPEVQVSIPVGSYTIDTKTDGDLLSLSDYGFYLVPGKPKLPSRIFAIAIPPNTEYDGLTVDPGEPVIVTELSEIPPSPLFRVIGEENPAIYARDLKRYEDNYTSVYENDDYYPSQIVEFQRTSVYRKYKLVDIRVTPFKYNPVKGEILYYPNITVTINCKQSINLEQQVIDCLENTEKTAENLILNYRDAYSWYPQIRSSSKDLFNLVIITLTTLEPYITELVSWETVKGKNVNVVTTAWINANYTGYDLAEKMRNFLRDKYPSEQWGIEDVLIIGHYDDVPMRRVAQDIGYGNPETDFYYAELSNPDNTSWDADSDHQWCDDDFDHIDYYSEVNVGRIPWSEASIVQHICRKTVAYEQNNDTSYKKNILLLGAFFWDDDPNPRTDNAVLMEEKIDQPWMVDWTKTKLYEQGYSTFPMDYNLTNANVVSVWSSGTFGFVNWAGHGSPTSSHIYHSSGDAFISSGNCPYLNDNYPAIIFADACSNSDTDHLNIGQAMMNQGGVAFVGATKVALGCPGWNDKYDGSGQSLDYFFTTYVTSGNYTVGQAHQQALRDMYTYGLWDVNKYEACEWGALWGNPCLSMAEVVQRPITIDYPDGLPEIILPGQSTPITVRITDNSESYLQGSGLLHYRYDGASFNTVQLNSIGDNLFTATLPSAYCNSTPEFYFSAQSNGGTTVIDPSDAPDHLYSTNVGEFVILMDDDFEADLGWTVSGDAVDGQWNRGVPIGGGDRGDPSVDADGSGQCYLTDNEDGNSDIDDGTIYLTSPTINLLNNNAIISFSIWYTNNFGDNPGEDYFVIWISPNNGITWQVVDSIGPNSLDGWTPYSFSVDSYITPSSRIKMRFAASDLGGGSVVEAGIDGFNVNRFNCEDPGYGYLPGDVNMALGLWPPQIIGGDVTYLVNYFRGIESSAPCNMESFWASADLNGDCQVIGGDVTKLVSYFRGVTPIEYCPDYEPLWLSPEYLPAEMPSGWPGCE